MAGRVIVGIFFIVWIGAIIYYKAAKIDEKYATVARRAQGDGLPQD